MSRKVKLNKMNSKSKVARLVTIAVMSSVLTTCGKDLDTGAGTAVMSNASDLPELEKVKAEAALAKAEAEKLKAEAEAAKASADADRARAEQKAEADKTAAIEAARLTSDQACSLAKAFRCAIGAPEERGRNKTPTTKILGCERFMSFSEKGTAKIRVMVQWHYPAGGDWSFHLPARTDRHSYPFLLTKSDSGWIVEKCGAMDAEL